MKHNTNTFNPDQDAVLTYQPDFQTTPFVVKGIGSAVLAVAEQVESMAPMPAVSHVEAPQTVIHTEQAYLDTTTLSTRELARRKISAFVFDKLHGTTMYEAFTQKIEDDRNVAFAQKLGLITTTYCQKHAKAVAELKKIV